MMEQLLVYVDMLLAVFRGVTESVTNVGGEADDYHLWILDQYIVSS
jgi:hypothetical protein